MASDGTGGRSSYLGILDDEAAGDRGGGVVGLALGGLARSKGACGPQGGEREEAGDAEQMHLGLRR